MSERPRRPRFDGEMTITIQGGWTSTIFYLVITLGYVTIVSSVLVGAARGVRDDQGADLLSAIVSLPFAIWFAASLVWRLADKSPLFHADRSGLRVHPSIVFQPLPWSTIKSISLQDSRQRGVSAKDVRILLREPARGLLAPFGSREIHLSLSALFLSRQDGVDLLRQLRLIRAAGEERAA